MSMEKEGWLHKRGEHIKTWRPRYFILRANGYFLGFNSQPVCQEELDSPNNVFMIKDCKVSLTDKPKPNMFTIRLKNDTSSALVDRYFAASSSNERDEWIDSIEKVSTQLNGNFVIEKAIKDKHKKITLHDFDILKLLGKGTFGKVLLCREKTNQRLCAIKMLKKDLIIEKNEIVHTQTERNVMRTIKHPFIISLIYSFQTSDLLCLVMEYLNGGELFFHLNRERRFDETKSRFYCAELCCAVGFLHQNDIIYRDIKLENILLDREGHIKLADFGLCKANMSHLSKTNTFCGTLEYLAPEIILNDSLDKSGYTRAVDWWAIGVVLYEMLIGRLPFSFSSKKDLKSLFNKILNEEPVLPEDLSIESKQILLQLLEKQTQKRLGSSANDFDEVKKHAFFRAIDWNMLVNRQLEPPFKPQISSEMDTKYFCDEFTAQSVQLTPPLFESKKRFGMQVNLFDSYSFYGSRNSLESSHSSNRSYKYPDVISAAFRHDSTTAESSNYTPIYSLSRKFKPTNCTGVPVHSSENAKFDKKFHDSSFLLASYAFPNFIHIESENHHHSDDPDRMMDSSCSISSLSSSQSEFSSHHRHMASFNHEFNLFDGNDVLMSDI